MEMTKRKKILLVGCGKMGGSLLNGWLTQKAYDRISVVEPTKLDLPDGINLYSEVAALPVDYKPSVVVFAVKPQLMDEVVADYARFINENTVFLSIAAGKPISYFEIKDSKFNQIYLIIILYFLTRIVLNHGDLSLYYFKSSSFIWTIGFLYLGLIVYKFSIDSFNSSPAFKKTCGFIPIPTPGGVPVVIISPACNDINLLR